MLYCVNSRARRVKSRCSHEIVRLAREPTLFSENSSPPARGRLHTPRRAPTRAGANALAPLQYIHLAYNRIRADFPPEFARFIDAICTQDPFCSWHFDTSECVFATNSIRASEASAKTHGGTPTTTYNGETCYLSQSNIYYPA